MRISDWSSDVCSSDLTLQSMITVNGHPYHKARTRISYDHIPSQTILKNSYARLVRVQLEKKGERVAYIMGAGDEIPESLEQIEIGRASCRERACHYV